MSHFGASNYGFKPAAICTYSAGMWGGARAGVALRPFLSELGCLPVSATFQLAGAWKAFDESGELPEGSIARKLCHRALGQYEWHARAMRHWRSVEDPAGI